MKNFPLYRKYRNQNTWLKITSENEWNELRILGSFYNYAEYRAQTFVDRNLIADWIENADDQLEVKKEEEFLKFLEDCKLNKTLKSSI